MKRSEGQNQGRPPQFGTNKVQTTVRIPANVLAYLKKKHKALHLAIDAELIVPMLREMAEEQNRVAADLARDQEKTLDALVKSTRAEDAEDDGEPDDA